MTTTSAVSSQCPAGAAVRLTAGRITRLAVLVMLAWTAPPANALPGGGDAIAVVEVDGDVIRFVPVVRAAHWEVRVIGVSGTVWQQERDADRADELAIPTRGAAANLFGHLIGAIQQLDAEGRAQRTMVETLTERIAALEAALSRIEEARR